MQGQEVSWRDEGLFWHVIIDNPPVNVTSRAVRRGLMDAVHTLGDTPDKKAIVLSCAGRSFVAGGDMTEFDGPPLEPHLPDICNAIEASALPWIAVMEGHVLGGGLEIAMSASFRIAHRATRFGMSEVKIGLIPGAGGSQRLPRLIGLEVSIPMLSEGVMISADVMEARGGLDMVYGDDEDGLALARQLIDNLPPLPVPVSRREIADGNMNLITSARERLSVKTRGQSAPLANLEMLDVALQTGFAKGQPIERKRHLQMRSSAEFRALRHVFMAERQVAKPALIADGKVREVNKVAVVGGGLMGSGIAFSVLLSGFEVALIERNEAGMEMARSSIVSLVDGAKARGKLDAIASEELETRLTISVDDADIIGSNLAIEAVYEDLEVKRDVFRRLADLLDEEAILASNTSYLDPNRFMSGIANPERLLGMHFFSPAHIMKLVEVIVLNETARETLATGFAFVKKLRKTPVLSRVCDGFIGNRILSAYRRQADYLLVDGATPRQIDSAMKDFGMPMGPYEMQDMAGLQIAWQNRKRQDRMRPADMRYVDIGDQLCESGRFGQRSGHGWYRYEKGCRTPIEDPFVISLIERSAAAHGINRQTFKDEEIVKRCLAVMVNEGALLVEEGIAERDLDVDVVEILGYGFPRWRGGPLHYANEIGWAFVAKAMQDVMLQSPNSWDLADRLK